MSYGRMCEEEKRLAAEVREWLDRAEREDRNDDDSHGKGRRGDELPEWVKNKQARLAKIREAKARLEAAAKEEAERIAAERAAKARELGRPVPGNPPKALDGVPEEKAQTNFTDPESRIMKTRDGYEQAYNCQLAVDADSHVIVANAVLQKQNDVHELVPMVDAIIKNAGRPAEISADFGYCSEANLAYLAKLRLPAYIATGRQAHGAAAPTNEKLTFQPRVIAMRARLRRGGYRSRYRLRKQTVEPVIGQIKEARGFRRFLMRGIEKVTGEWSLLCTAHNLLKLARARLLGDDSRLVLAGA
jgi:hypothetical protein